MSQDDEQQEEEKGFRVRDKRKLREDAPGTVAEKVAEASDEAARPLGDNAGVYIPGADEDGDHPPIDFGGFVLSLSTSAYVAMGKVEHPETGDRSVDAATARQLIDILEMLQVKTEGNLEPEEKQLLSSLLYDLRMQFVGLNAKKVDEDT